MCCPRLSITLKRCDAHLTAAASSFAAFRFAGRSPMRGGVTGR
jgi:hypothetical protein